MPSNGEARVGRDGTMHYSPDADWNGVDSFLVEVTDGNGDTARADVGVIVEAVNDGPTSVVLRSTSVNENMEGGEVVGALSTEDVDSEDSFSYALVEADGDTGNASFSIEGENLVTAGKMDHEAQQSYEVRVRSTDAAGAWTEQEFTIAVSDVNDPPVITGEKYVTMNEDGVRIVGLHATDQDGDTPFVVRWTHGEHGAVTRATYPFDFRYEPAPGWYGTDSFTVTIGDGIASETDRIHIEVEPAGDGGFVRF